jgi:beta-N-acetylhexosaminidase
MEEVAAAVPVLAGEAKRRADAALAQRAAPQEFDVAAARAMFARLVGSAGA